MKRFDAYAHDNQGVVQRLSRIEGQVRGIAHMVAEDRYCIDILQQIASMQAATDAVALLLLEDHVNGCVADGLRSGSDERVDEVVGILRRYLKR